MTDAGEWGAGRLGHGVDELQRRSGVPGEGLIYLVAELRRHSSVCIPESLPAFLFFRKVHYFKLKIVYGGSNEPSS